MSTSDTRGVARGAMPKRSRSARGPPVCIISMAQQASPNIMYQTELFRVQLSRSSTRVVSAISGAELIRDIAAEPPLSGHCSGRLARPLGVRPAGTRGALEPFEIALGPHVDEAQCQDADEDAELAQRDHA